MMRWLIFGIYFSLAGSNAQWAFLCMLVPFFAYSQLRHGRHGRGQKHVPPPKIEVIAWSGPAYIERQREHNRRMRAVLDRLHAANDPTDRTYS